MDEHDRRFAQRQGHLGATGYAKDPTWQTTIVTVSMFLNFFLLAYAVSARSKTNAQGNFELVGAPANTQFYVWAGVTLLACLLGAFAIQYREFSARWSARFLACGLPALAIGVLIYAAQA